MIFCSEARPFPERVVSIYLTGRNSANPQTKKGHIMKSIKSPRFVRIKDPISKEEEGVLILLGSNPETGECRVGMRGGSGVR